MNDSELIVIALEEARLGASEGGIPIGAAVFDRNGELLSRGHNRRVQNDDPAIHAETDAFRNLGRRRHYSDLTIVTTLSPCWYCAGLIRQFNFGKVVIGENRNFQCSESWLREAGVFVVVLDNPECQKLMETFIAQYPDLWYEDIGR